MSLSEFDIIERYFRGLGVLREELILGVGDDAALLRPSPGRVLALTMDTLVAGGHFPEDAPADSVGHKALAVNLSDLAAMGAEPLGVLLSLTMPAFDGAWLAGFCEGFGALAARHDVALMGGDTTRGPLSVTVQATGALAPGEALRRNGAQPGDVVLVSGTLGDAAVGLWLWQRKGRGTDPQTAWLRNRLNRPEPRISLGRLLAGRAHAAIDISDGLLADLGHVLEASGVGARIDADAVPVSAALRAVCPAGDARRYALAWGDDYELCASVDPAEADRLCRQAAELGVALTPVGRIVAGSGIELVDGAGRKLAAPGSGYRHFDGDGAG